MMMNDIFLHSYICNLHVKDVWTCVTNNSFDVEDDTVGAAADAAAAAVDAADVDAADAVDVDVDAVNDDTADNA